MDKLIAKVFFPALVSIGLLTLSGCEFSRDTRPSVLVITVENLSFDSVGCEGEETLPGFDVFCQEAIRFTHAFTPTTMSQGALASLVTGDYPVVHQVRDNGADYLSTKFRTVGEAALDRGFRTSFVSGGPPVFRKSGLDKGFELFEDNLEVNLGHLFRPAAEVFGLFNEWVNREANTSPFLSFLFLPDFQFSGAVTNALSTEMQEKSTESQMQELGEALKHLVAQLKSKKRWDSTYVFLVGLNGGQRSAELRSENTQVTLFIKPAHRPRDLGDHWTIDRNVSLVDVGVTLFDLFGETVEMTDRGVLEKASLKAVFDQPEPDWKEDRILASESGWTRWRLGKPVALALRQKQFLFIDGGSPQIYNSLVDHREMSALSPKDPLWLSFQGDLLDAAVKLRTEPPANLPPKLNFEVAESVFRPGELSDDLDWELRRVLEARQKEPTEVGWWARRALERADWTTLTRLGEVANKPFWELVGESHRSNNESSLTGIACANIFKSPLSIDNCEDETLVLLAKLVLEKNEEEKLAKRERFLRAYAFEKLGDKIGRLNLLNDAKWDVSLKSPREPQLSELFLALPKNHALFKQVSASLGAE